MCLAHLGACRGASHRGRRAQVVDLNLDNARTQGTLEGVITEDFCNLLALSLNNTYLTNLRHFPKLTKLRKVALPLVRSQPRCRPAPVSRQPADA